MELTLGLTLRHAREASGLSVREVARKAGVSPAQVSQIEGGSRKSPGFVSIARIAMALSLSLDDLASAAGLRDTNSPVRSSPFPVEEVRRIREDAALVAARAEALLAVLGNAVGKFSK